MTEPNYYMTPVNHPVFDNADPDKKKEFCLLGVHISLIMPRTEFVLRDEHNDTRLKQKEDTINHLEEELRTVREKHIQELETQYKRFDVDYGLKQKQKEETINHLEEELRSAREKHKQDLETQYNVMRKRSDVEYRHVESLNIKLKEDKERLMDGRDTYVREQVDRTVDVYKQQLNQEKKNTELQQLLNSRLQEELDSLKSRKTSPLVTVGSIAENEVEAYLGNMFTEGKLTNMSKTAENSDFHFELYGVRLLIEVKNYTNNIPQRPAVEKFLRDVVSTKVDGGIIVSCVDGVRFSFRKAVLDWDFHQNIPTLYLTDFFDNPVGLYGGVLAVINYIRFKKEFERDNDESAQEHKNTYMEILGDMETWVPLMERATKNAKSTLESITDMNQNILARLSKYDISTSALNKANNLHADLDENEIMNTARTCYENLKYMPTAKDLMENTGITQSSINKVGGMKAIRKYIEAI